MSRFEGVEYLNISEGFDTYLKIKENGTIVQNMLDVFTLFKLRHNHHAMNNKHTPRTSWTMR